MVELRGGRIVIVRLHFLSGALHRQLVHDGPLQEVLLQAELCLLEKVGGDVQFLHILNVILNVIKSYSSTVGIIGKPSVRLSRV